MARSRLELGTEVDYFYERVFTFGPSKGVYDGVEDWFRELKKKQECPAHAKYVHEITTCLLDEVFGPLTPKERITAKELHITVSRAYDRYTNTMKECGLNQVTLEQHSTKQDRDDEGQIPTPIPSATPSGLSSQ